MIREERIGRHRLFLGDWQAVPGLDALASAVVSDPPYGMQFDTNSRRFTGGKVGRGNGRADRKIIGDDKPFDPAPWLGFAEVILWGANHFSQRLPVGTTLVWLKKKPIHYGTFLSDAEVGWRRGGHGVYAFHAPDSNGLRRYEATGSAFGEGTAHPAQKPIALMEWCIGFVSGQTILDPYMGSGSTIVDCQRLGRVGIGIEIDPEYFEIACARVDEAVRQPRLVMESGGAA